MVLCPDVQWKDNQKTGNLTQSEQWAGEPGAVQAAKGPWPGFGHQRRLPAGADVNREGKRAGGEKCFCRSLLPGTWPVPGEDLPLRTEAPCYWPLRWSFQLQSTLSGPAPLGQCSWRRAC